MHISRSFIWKKSLFTISKYRKKYCASPEMMAFPEGAQIGIGVPEETFSVPEDTLFRVPEGNPREKRMTCAAGLGHALICRCTGRSSNLPENQVSRKQYYLPLPPPPFQSTGCKGQNPTRVMCSSHLVYYHKEFLCNCWKCFKQCMKYALNKDIHTVQATNTYPYNQYH